MNDDHAEYVLAQINEDLRAEVARLASECNDIAADRETQLGKQQLRIAELEDDIERYEAGYQWWLSRCIKAGTRIQELEDRLAKLEAALTWIGKADQYKHDWVTVGKLLDECSAIARNALEEGK